MTDQITFRKVTISDSQKLLQWRNDPITREGSIQPGIVTPDEHRKWFEASLKNPNREIYIARCQGAEIGTVRFDFQDGDWELSWTVAPEHRGKGLGKGLVIAATQMRADDLIARIKVGNQVSMKIAEAAGFKNIRVEGEVTYWKRQHPALKKSG